MSTDAEQFVELVRRRDAELAALREYVKAVEEALRQKRSDEAGDEAYREAENELNVLRHEHGFKSDGRWRGDS